MQDAFIQSHYIEACFLLCFKASGDIKYRFEKRDQRLEDDPLTAE
jgi:hypothetical protein